MTRRGVDLEILPYASTTPEALIAAGQAECGISFQDALTFAAAAGAPVVSVMAILQHTAQEIAVLASSDITRPRDLDGRIYAGFGYPNEEPTLKSRHQGRRRHGHVHDRHPRHGRLRRALRQASRFRHHVRGLGGHRGQGARHRASDLRVRRLRLPGLLPGRPRLRQPLAGSGARARSRVRRRDRPRLRARRRRSRRPRPPCSSPRTRASSRQPGAPARRASSSSPTGGYLRDEDGAVGRQTLAKWQGYSGFLFDQGLLAGPDGKPLTTRPTTRRCSPTTSCRDDRPRPGPLGTAARPGRDRRPGLGGVRSPRRAIDPITLPAPSRVVGALWDFRGGRGRPPLPDPRRGARRVRAVGGARHRGRPSRSIAGSPSAARSNRCSSPARRSRSWRSRRCS